MVDRIYYFDNHRIHCPRCRETDFIREGNEVYCASCFYHLKSGIRKKVIAIKQYRISVNYVPDIDIIPDLIEQERKHWYRFAQAHKEELRESQRNYYLQRTGQLNKLREKGKEPDLFIKTSFQLMTNNLNSR